MIFSPFRLSERRSYVSTTIWLHRLDSKETHGEKSYMGIAQKCSFERILETVAHKTAAVRLSHKSSNLNMQDMLVK